LGLQHREAFPAHEDLEDIELELSLEYTPAVQALLRTSRELAEKIVSMMAEARGFSVGFPSSIPGVEVHPVLSLSSVASVPGVAIDSTYPPEGGIDLVGGQLIGVVAGYIGFGGIKASDPCRQREVHAKAWFTRGEDAKSKVMVLSKLLEKAVARKVLDCVENGKMNARLILFDGEIVPYTLLFHSTSHVQSRRLLHKLDEVTKTVLQRAAQLGVTIVGVVKRSYSHMLAAVLGRRPPLNDKAIASLLLSRGTYFKLGSFRDILPQYASILARYRGVDPEKYSKVVRERVESAKEYGEVVVAFYKPSRGSPNNQAVRIEVLDYGGMGLDNVISVLDKLTNPQTGLPYPVDLIDEYTRLESRALELLRRKVLGEVALLARELGTPVSVLLGHTNPEKRYLYEPFTRE
jgi:uncharacterized protein YutE (UPF0331/DUF86 family)